MRFESITDDVFREYANESPYRSFMQTPEIAENRKNDGWNAHYLAIKDKDGMIIAATLILSKKTFFGKSLFIVPGGPLVDYKNKELTDYFITNLKKYAKKRNGYLLRISPYFELVERDRNGEIIKNGFDNREVIENLLQLGFKPSTEYSQPKYLFVLDINNRKPDELFNCFKRNTRNHIRKAEKKGVKIRELKKEELNIFKNITESTSKRRNFTDRTLDYYEQMYDLFYYRGEVKFIVAEAKINDKTVPISAAMFILYGDEIIYLFSGSTKEYMREYNAQYLIQWYMIKYAAENHFKRYNFYGIQGLPNPDSKDNGVYEFKKGFDGHVVEEIGTYELPLDILIYRLHGLAINVKKNIKVISSKIINSHK